MLLPNLVQVTESISGSVVPVVMFFLLSQKLNLWHWNPTDTSIISGHKIQVSPELLTWHPVLAPFLDQNQFNLMLLHIFLITNEFSLTRANNALKVHRPSFSLNIRSFSCWNPAANNFNIVAAFCPVYDFPQNLLLSKFSKFHSC